MDKRHIFDAFVTGHDPTITTPTARPAHPNLEIQSAASGAGDAQLGQPEVPSAYASMPCWRRMCAVCCPCARRPQLHRTASLPTMRQLDAPAQLQDTPKAVYLAPDSAIHIPLPPSTQGQGSQEATEAAEAAAASLKARSRAQREQHRLLASDTDLTADGRSSHPDSTHSAHAADNVRAVSAVSISMTPPAMRASGTSLDSILEGHDGGGAASFAPNVRADAASSSASTTSRTSRMQGATRIVSDKPATPSSRKPPSDASARARPKAVASQPAKAAE
ncbi:hypothetical protein EON66_01500, partial [archaeon]